MADTSPPPSDLKSHVKGYEKFIAWFKWGTVVCFIIAAFVVYQIAA